MIKLIATDVDGTLVKDGTLSINPQYYRVIEALIDQGIHFVVCSGRQYTSIEKLFRPIKEKLMYVTDGGTAIRSYTQILKVYELEEHLWKEIQKDVRRNPALDQVLATPDYSLAEDAGSRMFTWLRDSYGFRMKEVPNLGEVTNEQVIKLSVYHPTSCEEICTPEFIPKWKDKVSIACAGKEWIDCVSLEANKGTAIKWLQQYWGIKPEETMAFGDNLNDIEMLKAAGESYAVGNAREECKAVAGHVIKPYSEDGVLEILKSLL